MPPPCHHGTESHSHVNPKKAGIHFQFPLDWEGPYKGSVNYQLFFKQSWSYFLSS